jgi:hypothetical protein
MSWAEFLVGVACAKIARFSVASLIGPSVLLPRVFRLLRQINRPQMLFGLFAKAKFRRAPSQ